MYCYAEVVATRFIFVEPTSRNSPGSVPGVHSYMLLELIVNDSTSFNCVYRLDRVVHREPHYRRISGKIDDDGPGMMSAGGAVCLSGLDVHAE